MSNLREAVNEEGSSASVVIRNVIRYEECCKNHGARTGKSSIDGCMEFMASDSEGGELTCDACGCHRNFHRKKVVEDGSNIASSEVRYEDCCKNHAIRLGKYSSTDGCLEFMASEGEAGLRAALYCAACGCHRNFHTRKEEKEKVVPKPSTYPSYGGAIYDSDDYYD